MDVQTTRPQEEVFFHERADTFQLTATLVGEERLIITLKDFVDWIIYNKEYMEEDYCKEIHKKMELIDVYTSFAQTKPQCDEEKMRQKQNQADHLKKYEFGTVVESQNEKIPCYKIEKGGRVTTYLNYLDRETKKQVAFESNLILSKIRSMTETEISAVRSTMVKIQIFEELSREIQNQSKEKEELLKRVIKLEEENQRQKEELRRTKQTLMAKDAEQEQKINKTRQNLEAAFNSTKEDLLARNQQLQYQLNLTRSEIQATQAELAEQKQDFRRLKQELNQMKGELKERLELHNQPSLEKLAQIEETKTQALKPDANGDWSQLMTLPQTHSNQFKFNEYNVQYIGTLIWTHYIFNFPLNPNQIVSFKIKITKTHCRNMMIGVVDYAKQKEQRYSHNSGNAMCYVGYSAKKYPQCVIEGDGFMQGDLVEVQVNRVTSTIKYIANGVLKATHTNNMLADNSRIFMPYVEMINDNDCVEWLQ